MKWFSLYFINIRGRLLSVKLNVKRLSPAMASNSNDKDDDDDDEKRATDTIIDRAETEIRYDHTIDKEARARRRSRFNKV